jgi:hypothetical protein
MSAPMIDGALESSRREELKTGELLELGDAEK